MASRADLPAEEQILAALRGLSVLSCGSALAESFQAIAFQTLLGTAKPVPVDYLAAGVDTSAVEVSRIVEELRLSGQVCLDSKAYIIGAVGLTLLPTLYGLLIDGRTFWAWCAYEVISIFAALRASGSVQSLGPDINETLRLEFVDSVPQSRNLVVFMADLSGVSSTCDD
jgi:hypothetical protein